jgi:hypothetical protein
MLVGFSSSHTSEEDGVFASWSNLSELVEGQALTAGLDDSSSGGTGELQSADSELWNNWKSLVVQNSANNNQNSLLLVLGVSNLDQSAQRDWESVVQTLVKSLVDNFVELRVSSSGKELVKLGSRE